MKNLYELARYSSKQSRVIESLVPSNKESPLYKLNSIVLEQKEIDDNKAMIEIYGRRNIAAFSRLKSRLKDILTRTIILQNNSSEASESRINESINQFRNAFVVKLLYDLNERSLCIEMAEKSILKSIKYHATESVILFARILVRHYGTSEYNKYKLNKYLSIQEKYLRIHEWEIKAENYFFDLQRTQLQSLAAPSDQTQEKARQYVTELESITDIQSVIFNWNRYKVKAAFYEYQKDYKSMLKFSEDTLKEFSSPDLRTGSVSLITSINIRRCWALIQAGRNEETILIGLKEMKNLPFGSSGWYFIAHYVLKAYLYNGDYINAIDVISNMIDNPKFQKMSNNHQELFNTTLGYIHLIVESGIAGNTKELQKSLPDFKLGKFLNTTPVFSKDKRGINVSILLMHVAVLLQRKEYDSIIDRIDSLNQYAYRYLRKDDSFRSNCMIKMVIQMTKADFHSIRTERYTRDLLKQLERVKLAGSGENIETEIIPYEVLWQIMKKSL